MLMPQLPEFLTDLEAAVLQFLLQEDTEITRALREQLATCTLESRERNGYGFFTNFHVIDSAPKCSIENIELGDASAVVGGEKCGFILFVREGRIEFLEGFPLGGDSWPTSEQFEKVTGF